MFRVPADPSLDNLQKIILSFVIIIELKSVVNPTPLFWKKAWVRTNRRAKPGAPTSHSQGAGQWGEGCRRFIEQQAPPWPSACYHSVPQEHPCPLQRLPDCLTAPHLLEPSRGMKRRQSEHERSFLYSSHDNQRREKASFFSESLCTLRFPEGSSD